tara:strand:+ start:224 stop:568 length:345 start_codon:yes stop_codon:yes gene_type:complete
MFDPSELTVKQARARLCEFDVEGLEALLQAEIDGKHRSSLIADIGRAIDMIKTAEEAEVEAVEVETVEVVEHSPLVPSACEPPRAIIPEQEWFRYPRHVRKEWERLANGMFRKR